MANGGRQWRSHLKTQGLSPTCNSSLHIYTLFGPFEK
ncbi:hypothetical protein COLO4_25280 [Corchorus olitorius]|uniref:Uncharacterized protein n=1 Tax=Corchorus olitorius TaxID=93759 RepID=A0A1R3I3R3_9ROSI|nr:hypothetical protein COLO4_25280 [Corchorus olitorius]